MRSSLRTPPANVNFFSSSSSCVDQISFLLENIQRGAISIASPCASCDNHEILEHPSILILTYVRGHLGLVIRKIESARYGRESFAKMKKHEVT